MFQIVLRLSSGAGSILAASMLALLFQVGTAYAQDVWPDAIRNKVELYCPNILTGIGIYGRSEEMLQAAADEYADFADEYINGKNNTVTKCEFAADVLVNILLRHKLIDPPEAIQARHRERLLSNAIIFYCLEGDLAGWELQHFCNYPSIDTYNNLAASLSGQASAYPEDVFSTEQVADPRIEAERAARGAAPSIASCTDTGTSVRCVTNIGEGTFRNYIVVEVEYAGGQDRARTSNLIRAQINPDQRGAVDIEDALFAAISAFGFSGREAQDCTYLQSNRSSIRLHSGPFAAQCSLLENAFFGRNVTFYGPT